MPAMLAHEPAWLADRRTAARDRFAALGLPSRRQESWRYSNLAPVKLDAPVAAPTDRAPDRSALAEHTIDAPTHRLVFVNGRLDAALSKVGRLPDGAWLGATSAAIAERPDLLEAAIDDSDVRGNQPFASFNAAHFHDGFVLALEPGVILDDPVEIVHLGFAAAPCWLNLRNAVTLGVGSKATLVESFAGTGAYQTNAVTAIRLDPDASLHHVKLQEEGREAVHLALVRARLDRATRYESFLLATGARLARHETLAALAGEGAYCGLDGAYLLRGEQEGSVVTAVDHAAPGGVTRELFKGVVEERAHGVFLGRIAVRPDAQRTDAHQLNRNLLLSRRAAIDTKPELEILADDVKCSHGATVGDLDETALFYLESRGIPAEAARRMLIEAFAADAIERVGEGAIRAHLLRRLEQWLGEARP